MTKNAVKKLIIGGAIILAATAPLLGKKNPQKEVKLERVVMLSQSDSLIETPFRLSNFEERIVGRLDELSARLAKDGFDRDEIIKLYTHKNFKIERDIIRYYSFGKKYPPMSYDQYRRKLGLDELIRRAPEFYQAHKTEIEKAARKYGFDSRQIVSTIAIETVFGTYLGDYKSFNAIVAMFASDRYKELGYRQIKAYIPYCKKEGVDLFSYPSSIAGAIGPMQVMPENLRIYWSEKNPMDLIECFHIIAKFHKDAGWDPRQNGKIPSPGSRNWQAIHNYNNSNNYVRARNELAASLKISPIAVRVVPGLDQ